MFVFRCFLYLMCNADSSVTLTIRYVLKKKKKTTEGSKAKPHIVALVYTGGNTGGYASG